MRHALDAAGVAPSSTASVYGRGSSQGGSQGNSQGGGQDGFSQRSAPSSLNFGPNSGYDPQGGAGNLNGQQTGPNRADESGELPFWLRPDGE
jgi:hypothetical protein